MMKKVMTAAALALALAAGGCRAMDAALRARARADVAAALRVARDAGGSGALCAKVDELVAEGRLSAGEGAVVKAVSAEAFERLLARLEGGEGVSESE